MQRDVVRFEKGSILRKEMLESMYSFPRFLCDGYYSKYGNGVLYGLEWEKIDDKHFISPGALKYNGEIYFQTEKLVVEDSIDMVSLESGQEYYVYFKEASPEKTESREIFELVLSFEKKPVEDGICIRYVKYVLGSIRDSDQKIFGLYATPDSSAWGLPPCVIKDKIYNNLLEKKIKHPLDYEILKCVYDNRPLSTTFIELYISEYNSLEGKTEKNDFVISENCIKELVDEFVKAVQKLVLPVSVIQNTEAVEKKSAVVNRSGGML
ncbi:MAG: hypothetical protein IJN05_06360 [Ruminococcus sp.]|nr:hypothetical protein [Ruminococcus sp.]